MERMTDRTTLIRGIIRDSDGRRRVESISGVTMSNIESRSGLFDPIDRARIKIFLYEYFLISIYLSTRIR